MSFKEPGSVRYEMIDGKKVPIIECEAEITVINKKTNKEYASDKEAEDDINNPDIDTVKEDILRSVKIRVAAMPPIGAASDE